MTYLILIVAFFLVLLAGFTTVHAVDRMEATRRELKRRG